MYITLNSKRYYLVPSSPVSWSNVQDLSQAFRTQGAQRRIDNVKVNRYIRGWTNGLGFARLRRETAPVLNGLRDADANTMHPNVVTLPLLPVTETHADPAEHLKAYVNFKGELWAAFEEDFASGEITGAYARKYAADSDVWEGGGEITAMSANAGGCRVFDMFAHKGKLYAITNDTAVGTSGANGEDSYLIRSSSDGASWSDADGTGWRNDSDLDTTTTRRNSINQDDSCARGLDFGNHAVVVLWTNPGQNDGVVRVGYSTDAGSNWTFNAGLVIPSGTGPKALIAAPDPLTTGTPLAPWLITVEGVYVLDLANNTFNKILDLGGSPQTGQNSIFAKNGAVYIPLEDGDILEVMVGGVGLINVTNVGPNTKAYRQPGDGLVAARQGYATVLNGENATWLVVAYSGTADGLYGTILAMEYATGAWHSIYLNETDQRRISELSISNFGEGTGSGTPRIHWTEEGGNNVPGAATVNKMIEYPFNNPLTTTVQSYKTTGYVEWSDDDLGDPHSSSATFRALLDADDLDSSTSGEYVQLKYGDETENWESNTLGNFLSGDKDLDFGTSSRGVSMKRLKVRLNFVRDGGSAVQTPKLREFEIQARNKLLLLERYASLAIDLGLTAHHERITPFEVFTRLRADIESVTTLPFKITERAAEQQVEVVAFESQLTTPGQGVSVESQELSGVILLTLEEVLNV